ncbi:MAG: putative selenate ABC transporter substrate-binding protein [Alphaproteobacteria bacterium]|nr:putative selenate ABC transporter substrate-binding protein [Alphaproteobacteria bacterium]
MGLIVASAASGEATKNLTFTAIPDQDESRLRVRFNKIAIYLTKKVGVNFKYIPVKSYTAAITAFRNNQVQLAWFGGLSGVRARRLVPGSGAIAQGYEDQFFVTYFIAHKSTGLKLANKFPTGIKGKTFTFGSKGSTSGRLMPEFHIRRVFGAAPETVFRRVGFSGSHSRTIALVQAGAYQVGAINFKVWEKELKLGRIDNKRIRIIWKTPTYPDYHWTVRGDLAKTFGPEVKKKLRQALLQMKDPDLLKSFPRSSFVPAKNADYDVIEKVAKSIGLID